MTLIDGIGDEVVQFVAVLVIVVVSALAWWSTNARPDRYRTVLVMRSRAHHPVTVSIRARNNLMLTNTPQPNNSVQESTTETISVGTPEIVEESSRDLARVIPLQEMDSIVDADMAMMDNNRLHFYRRIDSPGRPQSAAESTSEENESPEEAEPASNAQIREMDSIVSAMEADVSTRCDFFTRSNEPNSTRQTNDVKEVKKENKNNLDTASVTTQSENVVNVDNASADSENASNEAVVDDSKKILIKLKYLNDTLKEVEGSLDELLKDFKWRHFSVELSSECLVRLIYKGRVLDEASTLRACGLTHRAVVHCLVHPKRNTTQGRVLDEASTLRACGLTHRAVVHCLVHPKRNTTQQSNPGTVNASSAAGGEAGAPHELVSERAPDRVWDLENILMTLVSVALTVVWFFRCEYSNMFTASASVALFGLTVFYSVAIFGLYISDTFHFDRRPAQPVPPN